LREWDRRVAVGEGPGRAKKSPKSGVQGPKSRAPACVAAEVGAEGNEEGRTQNEEIRSRPGIGCQA
jgi:hypothetical protein